MAKFDTYKLLEEQLEKKLTTLESKMYYGSESLNDFISILRDLTTPSSSSAIETALNNMNADDVGLGDDLLTIVNYYTGDTRDFIVNKLKKFVDTQNEIGIYYNVLNTLDPSLNEYQTVVNMQNVKEITNNLGSIAEGRLSFKSRIEAVEDVMLQMADEPGEDNVSTLNDAKNRLKKIIKDMQMAEDNDYNIDIDYIVLKYAGADLGRSTSALATRSQLVNNIQRINAKCDEIAAECMGNVRYVLNQGGGYKVDRKYW